MEKFSKQFKYIVKISYQMRIFMIYYEQKLTRESFKNNFKELLMTTQTAFIIRVKELLTEKKMCLRDLEAKSRISYTTLKAMLNGKIKNSNFKTMAAIIHAFGLTYSEFFDHPAFNEKTE